VRHEDAVDALERCAGLKDVSQYPNLFRVLLARGYSEAYIEKIASGNVFRVWMHAEAHAARQAVSERQQRQVHGQEGRPAERVALIDGRRRRAVRG